MDNRKTPVSEEGTPGRPNRRTAVLEPKLPVEVSVIARGGEPRSPDRETKPLGRAIYYVCA